MEQKIYWFVYNIDLSTNEFINGKYKIGINSFGLKSYSKPEFTRPANQVILILYSLYSFLNLDANIKYDYVDIIKK